MKLFIMINTKGRDMRQASDTCFSAAVCLEQASESFASGFMSKPGGSFSWQTINFLTGVSADIACPSAAAANSSLR